MNIGYGGFVYQYSKQCAGTYMQELVGRLVFSHINFELVHYNWKVEFEDELILVTKSASFILSMFFNQ